MTNVRILIWPWGLCAENFDQIHKFHKNLDLAHNAPFLGVLD